MSRSLAEEIALLPAEEQQEALEGYDPDALLYDAKFWLRPEQLPPPDDDWRIWAQVAGRGAGKTRSGSEFIREKAKTPSTRMFLVGRTAADVRDTMVGGESGLLAVHPPSEAPEWMPSRRLLTWPNGSSALAFSAEVADQLRGPQSSYSWCDELAAWSFVPDDVGLDAWTNVNIATRLGENPQILVTTTPKNVPALRTLVESDDPKIRITRGSTRDNQGNLSQAYLDYVYGLYGNTRLARQELEGILLGDDTEGALWTRELIDAARHLAGAPLLPIRVVAVDPSVAENPKDECGIVVVGCTNERRLSQRHAYVLNDASVHGSPRLWARVVVETAIKYRCPIVAEKNQGHELVRMALQNEPGGADIPIYLIGAHQNKQLRADPVSHAYDQGRVHHVGYHPLLEDQMTTWVPGAKKSPDRLDAVVHGLTALLIRRPDGFNMGGPLRARSVGNRTVQGVRKGALGRPGLAA